jgi:hypothetical protein
MKQYLYRSNNFSMAIMDRESPVQMHRELELAAF